MQRISQRSSRQRLHPVARLRGVEALPSRLVLSGMAMWGPVPTEEAPQPDQLPAETGFAHHELRDSDDADLASFTEDIVAGDDCAEDPAIYIRAADPRESEELGPVAQPRAPLTEGDIPEELRANDELFGGHNFWVQGSRPWDDVAQQSGRGDDSHLAALNELTPILPSGPIEQIAGPPESNVDSLLGNLPSEADLRTCQLATLGSAPRDEITVEDDTAEEEEETEAETEEETEESENEEGLLERLQNWLNEQREKLKEWWNNEETTPDPATPPQDDWEPVQAPPWAPPWMKAQTAALSEGGSQVNGGLSSATTHMDKK